MQKMWRIINLVCSQKLDIFVRPGQLSGRKEDHANELWPLGFAGAATHEEHTN